MTMYATLEEAIDAAREEFLADNPGIDAEKLLDKAASVKIASSLMGGWTVAE